MTVIVLTRYSGGTWGEVSRLGKEAKRIIGSHGGSWRIAHAYAGAYTGQWVAMVEYANWETYGKATQALSEDSEYQKLMVEVSAIAKLEGRGVMNVMDV